MKTSLVLETDNKTKHVMRLSMCWIVTSIIALVCGLIMVLVFCHVLIVPHMRTKDYVTTDCVIDDITVIPDVTNVTCAHLSTEIRSTAMTLHADKSNCEVTLGKTESSGKTSQLFTNQQQNENSHCVQVGVVYKAFDGFPRKALLQTQPLEETKNSEGSKLSEKVGRVISQFN